MPPVVARYAFSDVFVTQIVPAPARRFLRRARRGLALAAGADERRSAATASGPAPIRPPRRCPNCRSLRLVRHAELAALSIAHLDCDAFYASVEKRDRPELRDQALIVGGGVRGVVTTCCYIARMSGVRSAMPMFKARKLCPEAVVMPPDFAKYRAESRPHHGQAARA